MAILTSRVGIIAFIIFFFNISVSSADFNPRKIYDNTSPTVVLITGFEPGKRIMSKHRFMSIRKHFSHEFAHPHKSDDDPWYMVPKELFPVATT